VLNLRLGRHATNCGTCRKSRHGCRARRAGDPQNAYYFTVTDAAGQVTGRIANAEVTYTKTPDGPCGLGVWEGPLTSD